MYSDPERQRAAEREWYKANKAKVAEKKNRKRQRLREIVRSAKAVPCADCGCSYPYYVMDLDHIGEDKTMIVSKLVNFGATARLLAEIAKCEVVCANCHRARSWLRMDHSRRDVLEKRMEEGESHAILWRAGQS